MRRREGPKWRGRQGPTAPPPAKLYRYRTCARRNIQNLAAHQLWFSSYEHLNDPMDRPGVTDLDQIQTEPLMEVLQNPVTGELFKRFNPRPPARGSEWDIRWRRLNSDLDGQLEAAGIACFSEIPNNLQMWTHYGEGHQGYCLEFSTSQTPLSATQPIAYVSELAGFSPYSQRHPQDDQAVPLLTKHTDWSYEKEWRIIAPDKANQNFRYPTTALTGVYLGANIRPRNESLIRRAIQRGGLSPKFYRLRVSGLSLIATSIE